MKLYKCEVCKYVYNPLKGDPENDIAPGTPFTSLPDDWRCPVCGYGKDEFEETDIDLEKEGDDEESYKNAEEE